MVIDAKLKRLHAMGHGGLSEAQLSLYVHLDIEGTRLTALADRAALTKQSMIELIDRAEVSGFVTRAPDPQDGRAKIVRFTPTGRRFLSDLGHATVQVEAQLCETLGADRLRALKACLSRYAESPCEPGGGSASGVGVGDDAALSWRIDNAGRVFGAASRRFGQQVVTSMHGLGHADLSPAQLALYRNLDLEGSRLTDLAIRARITKPSMRELVGRAVRLGHVSQRPDPQDRRSRRICFTAAGLRLLDDFRSSVETTETRFGAVTARPRLTWSKHHLN